MSGKPTAQHMLKTGPTPMMCWTIQRLPGKHFRCDTITLSCIQGGRGGGLNLGVGWVQSWERGLLLLELPAGRRP